MALVAHGHLLRILASVYLGLPPSTGAHLELDAGSVCELNVRHDVPDDPALEPHAGGAAGLRSSAGRPSIEVVFLSAQ